MICRAAVVCKKYQLLVFYAKNNEKSAKRAGGDEKETRHNVYEVRDLQALKTQDFAWQKNTKNFPENYCINQDNVIYYKGLCKAMRWEVTLL